MDFVSLDLDLGQNQGSSGQGSSVQTSSGLPFYRTIIFKAVAVLTFLAILCFPQPIWLSTVISHPIGSMTLASLVGIALLPELEWWIVVVSVVVGYGLLALTGVIESNLENKRKKIIEKEDAEKKATEEVETDENGEIVMDDAEMFETPINRVGNQKQMIERPKSSSQLHQGNHPMRHTMPFMMSDEPMAANA